MVPEGRILFEVTTANWCPVSSFFLLAPGQALSSADLHCFLVSLFRHRDIRHIYVLIPIISCMLFVPFASLGEDLAPYVS